AWCSLTAATSRRWSSGSRSPRNGLTKHSGRFRARDKCSREVAFFPPSPPTLLPHGARGEDRPTRSVKVCWPGHSTPVRFPLGEPALLGGGGQRAGLGRLAAAVATQPEAAAEEQQDQQPTHEPHPSSLI